MYGRLQAFSQRLVLSSLTLGKRAGSAIAVALLSLLEEIVIAAGLALVGYGFWLAWKPGAFIVPGFVLLWMAIPQRSRFVKPKPVAPENG